MFPVPTVPILRLYFKQYYEPKLTKLLIPISENLVQHLKPYLNSLIHRNLPHILDHNQGRKAAPDPWISQPYLHRTEPILSRTNPQPLSICFIKSGV